MRRIAILDAPSNLGLRPPTPGAVPGCAKAPGALRDHGLVARLDARDAGCHTPPRFDPSDWRPGDGVSQAVDIARYSIRLAERITSIVASGEFAVVLGGDCSILLGSQLAMRRLGEEFGGRIGLVYIDAHSDFRHPGNAKVVGAAAGEALALVTGRGQADLAAIDQRRPYVRDSDVVVVGLRPSDQYRMDLQAAGLSVRGVTEVRTHGAARTAQWARGQLSECLGYWIHLDVDVLDPSVMPAVDAPDPGGIAYPELELLIKGLVCTPDCLGIEITVFDPDYDIEGRYARDIVNALVTGLGALDSAPEPVRRAPGAVHPDRAHSRPERNGAGSDGGGGAAAEPAEPAEVAGPAKAAPPAKADGAGNTADGAPGSPKIPSQSKRRSRRASHTK